MTDVAFSSSFRRAFRRRVKGRTGLEERFWEKLERFTKDPFEPSLRTHKLAGALHELWSFTVDYDTRVVFAFIGADKALFVDIGTHDEVY